jgi:hypothetical protein
MRSDFVDLEDISSVEGAENGRAIVIGSEVRLGGY